MAEEEPEGMAVAAAGPTAEEVPEEGGCGAGGPVEVAAVGWGPRGGTCAPPSRAGVGGGRGAGGGG